MGPGLGVGPAPELRRWKILLSVHLHDLHGVSDFPRFVGKKNWAPDHTPVSNDIPSVIICHHHSTIFTHENGPLWSSYSPSLDTPTSPGPTAQDLSVITGCLTGADGAQWAILFRVDDITSVERMRWRIWIVPAYLALLKPFEWAVLFEITISWGCAPFFNQPIFQKWWAQQVIILATDATRSTGKCWYWWIVVLLVVYMRVASGWLHAHGTPLNRSLWAHDQLVRAWAMSEDATRRRNFVFSSYNYCRMSNPGAALPVLIEHAMGLVAGHSWAQEHLKSSETAKISIARAWPPRVGHGIVSSIPGQKSRANQCFLQAFTLLNWQTSIFGNRMWFNLG